MAIAPLVLARKARDLPGHFGVLPVLQHQKCLWKNLLLIAQGLNQFVNLPSRHYLERLAIRRVHKDETEPAAFFLQESLNT